MDPWDAQPAGESSTSGQYGGDSMYGWDAESPSIGSYRDVGRPLYPSDDVAPTYVGTGQQPPLSSSPARPSALVRGASATMTGVRFLARVAVSLLWVAVAVVAVQEDKLWVAGIAAAYLVYLWIFRGRWLLW